MKNISLTLVLFLIATLALGNMSMTSHILKSNSTGLVAWYPFNGNANDASGNANHGTVYGAILTADRFGTSNSAYEFDGVDDYIQCLQPGPLGTSPRTISFWAKTDIVPKPTQTNTVLSYGGSNLDRLEINLNSGANGLTVTPGNAYLTKAFDNTNADWHFYTVVFEGGTDKTMNDFKFYADGQLLTVTSETENMGHTINTMNTHPIHIGNLPDFGRFFKGTLDEIKFYSIALTEDEVKSSYHDLIAYYPFNGNAIDESGNGHDGTVYGGILTEDRNNSQNSAYTFPNLHNQIVLANTSNLTLQGGFTLNAWVKYKSINSGIVGKHNCLTSNGFLLGIEDGQFTLWISNGGWQIIKTNETYQENNWYMVTAVYDSVNKTGLLYTDGKLKSSGHAVYSNFNAANITISESSGSCPSGNMPGAIDEVKIYNRPLSAEEIRFEYNSSFTGLVAYYPFNGNADDASGNKNNGVVNNAVLTNDRYGIADKAYAFNGIDGYIEGTDPGNNLPTGNSSRTFAAWVKNYTFEQWGSNIYHYGTKEAAPTNFHFLITNVLGLGNGYGYGVTYGNTNIIDSTWHFIAGVYEGSSTHIAKVFVDGKPDSEGVLSTEPNTVLGSNWRIGRFMEGSTNFNGNIDDLRVCNTALTDQEIKDLYLAETTAPALQNPVNKSSVNTLTPEMLWSSPLANGEFRLQLSSDSLFGTILHNLVTTDLKTQLPDALLTEGQNYFWRVRTTLNGETGPWSTIWSFDFVNTGIEQLIRDDGSLKISPNPAHASAKIVYSIPDSNGGKSLVTIELVNSIGIVKAIKRLQNQAPGNYEITFDISDLEAGIYFCRLKTKTNQANSKMVVIH